MIARIRARLLDHHIKGGFGWEPGARAKSHPPPDLMTAGSHDRTAGILLFALLLTYPSALRPQQELPQHD